MVYWARALAIADPVTSVEVTLPEGVPNAVNPRVVWCHGVSETEHICRELFGDRVYVKHGVRVCVALSHCRSIALSLVT